MSFYDPPRRPWDFPLRSPSIGARPSRLYGLPVRRPAEPDPTSVPHPQEPERSSPEHARDLQSERRGLRPDPRWADRGRDDRWGPRPASVRPASVGPDEAEATPVTRSVMPPPSDNDALRRAIDDLAATEARVKREAVRQQEEARGKLVGELLPVLDNLDRSLDAARASTDQALVEGVRMVRSQLEQVLLRYGVERVDAVGASFDPAVHEAISMREVEPDAVGTVVDQASAGYSIAGRLLRPAQVVVGAARG